MTWEGWRNWKNKQQHKIWGPQNLVCKIKRCGLIQDDRKKSGACHRARGSKGWWCFLGRGGRRENRRYSFWGWNFRLCQGGDHNNRQSHVMRKQFLPLCHQSPTRRTHTIKEAVLLQWKNSLIFILRGRGTLPDSLLQSTTWIRPNFRLYTNRLAGSILLEWKYRATQLPDIISHWCHTRTCTVVPYDDFYSILVFAWAAFAVIKAEQSQWRRLRLARLADSTDHLAPISL